MKLFQIETFIEKAKLKQKMVEIKGRGFTEQKIDDLMIIIPGVILLVFIGKTIVFIFYEAMSV